MSKPLMALDVLRIRGAQQAYLVLLCAKLLCNDFPHIFGDLLDVLQHPERHQGQWLLVARQKQLRGRPSSEADLPCPDDHTAPLRDPDDLAGAHGGACAAGLLQPGDLGLGFVLRRKARMRLPRRLTQVIWRVHRSQATAFARPAGRCIKDKLLTWVLSCMQGALTFMALIMVKTV